MTSLPCIPAAIVLASEPVKQIFINEHPALAGFGRWNTASPRHL
jgi:hypothetical protein